MRQKKLIPSAIAGILLGSVALVGCSTSTATSAPTVSSMMTSAPTYTSSEGDSDYATEIEVNPAAPEDAESSATALDVAKQNTLLYDFKAEDEASAEASLSLFNT
ncbi:hypothetical protein SFC07_12675 [Corynebacterium callunae]|uniref:hypothetical protein n=1 Tax=Corynebacterium callunae TaxID=1721 RepID=UPI00398196E2